MAETTPHIGLTLPSPGGRLRDDVLGLWASFMLIDELIHEIHGVTQEQAQRLQTQQEDFLQQLLNISSRLNEMEYLVLAGL